MVYACHTLSASSGEVWDLWVLLYSMGTVFCLFRIPCFRLCSGSWPLWLYASSSRLRAALVRGMSEYGRVMVFVFWWFILVVCCSCSFWCFVVRLWVYVLSSCMAFCALWRWYCVCRWWCALFICLRLCVALLPSSSVSCVLSVVNHGCCSVVVWFCFCLGFVMGI